MDAAAIPAAEARDCRKKLRLLNSIYQLFNLNNQTYKKFNGKSFVTSKKYSHLEFLWNTFWAYIKQQILSQLKTL